MSEKKGFNHYAILTVFAYLTALFLGMGTYDISIHFSPTVVNFLLFAVPKELIGMLSIFVVDGLYILLDYMLPHFKTKSTRSAALYFMAALWVIMASANIASAVINNTIENSALGGFSWVVYGVKVGGLIYLAFYTYARWDDPHTQRRIIEIEMTAEMDTKVNYFEKTYGAKVGKYGGEMVGFVKSLEQYRLIFEEKTGMDIRTTLGVYWQRTLAKQVGFYVPEGFTFSDEPLSIETKPADATPALPDAGKKKKREVIVNADNPDAGNPDAHTETADAGNIIEKPKSMMPDFLQNALKKVSAMTGKPASNFP